MEVWSYSEWRDSRSHLGLETKQHETLGLVSFENQTQVSSRSRLALIFRSSLVSVSSRFDFYIQSRFDLGLALKFQV